MKGSDLIPEIRVATDDVNENIWSDAQYMVVINQARRDIYYEHTESRMTSNGFLEAFTHITDETATMPEDELYMSPIIFLATAKFYGADMGDTRDKDRSLIHLQQYKSFFTAGE